MARDSPTSVSRSGSTSTCQPASRRNWASGWAAMRAEIPAISALACSSDTPSFVRPKTERNSKPKASGVSSSGGRRSGTKTSAAWMYLKRGGITPTISCSTPSSTTVRPRTRSSPAKRRRQSGSEMTATLAPASSSPRAKPRPSAGCTPMTSKKLVEAVAPSTRSGSPPPVRFDGAW